MSRSLYLKAGLNALPDIDDRFTSYRWDTSANAIIRRAVRSKKLTVKEAEQLRLWIDKLGT